MGELFGNNPIWKFAIGWQSAMNSQGSQDMARLIALVKPRRWDLLVPDISHTFLTAGFSSGTSYASSASSSALAFVYMPTNRAVTINMANFSAAVSVQWFNPGTGAFVQISGSPFVNSGTHVFTPSGSNDWVLLFEVL